MKPIPAEPRNPTIVVHSLPLWLPLTSPWLYALVRNLPPEIVSHVCCERTAWLDQFAIGNLHCLRDQGLVRFVWEKACRKVGLRRSLRYLEDVIRDSAAAVVHSHWGDVAWRDRAALRRVRKAHVCTFYGKDVNYFPRKDPRWRERYGELFREVDRVLCEGPHMARCVVSLGCPAEKVTVLHLGVAVDQLPFRPRVWNPPEALRVLIASSFREKKGIPYAIEALGALRPKVAKLEVTLIGDSSADPRSHGEKARILDAIDKSGLREHVRLLGYQPHRVLLEEAYRHHIFVSPSVTAADGDTEGGAPVSIIEMAATGMPVVSTFHCDIPEVVVNDVTGMLASERDVEGLTACLERLVGRPQSWGPMLAAARRRMEEEFDVRVQSGILGKIYTSLARRES